MGTFGLHPLEQKTTFQWRTTPSLWASFGLLHTNSIDYTFKAVIPLAAENEWQVDEADGQSGQITRSVDRRQLYTPIQTQASTVSIESTGGQPPHPRDVFNQVLASGIELATEVHDSVDSGAENAPLVDKINRIEARLNDHCEQYTKDTEAFQNAYPQPPNSFTRGTRTRLTM